MKLRLATASKNLPLMVLSALDIHAISVTLLLHLFIYIYIYIYIMYFNMQYKYFNPAFTVYLRFLQCLESTINISFTNLQMVTILMQILLLNN